MAISRFGGYRPEQHLPLFQPLYRQQPPVLLVIKHLPHNSTIIELRLWQTGVQFKNSELPLWIGTINYHIQQQHLIALKKTSAITMAEKGGIDQLSKSLSHYQFKVIKITPQNQPQKVRVLNWDGGIIIIRVRHPSF